MLELANDLFASLSTSAKSFKDEEYNKTSNDSLSREDFSPIELSNYTTVDIDDDDIRRSKPKTVSKPIEETVEDIINNPEIKILKIELDTVEQLFTNLKDKGENLDALFRIEKRIENLKKLIEQKSYV